MLGMEKLRIAFAAVIVVVSTTFVPAQEKRNRQDIVRVPVEENTIRQGDTAGCGPISLLNMLKLGPRSFKKAYTEISGGSDAAALARLAKKYTSSTGKNGKAQFRINTGINDANLSRLCETVFKEHQLGTIDTLYTNRRPKENNSAFAKRVNGAIAHSLSEGIPVVMSVDSYGVRGKVWKKLTGHYMLITAVQPVGKTNPSSFLIEYVDPVGAAHRQAFLYASGFRDSRAIAHFKNGDKWLENNPYLYVAAPDKDLRESREPWSGRHELYLTILFGRLTNK